MNAGGRFRPGWQYVSKYPNSYFITKNYPTMANSTKSTAFKLSVMTLAIMNVAAVVSLRGLPAEATYGLSSAV